MLWQQLKKFNLNDQNKDSSSTSHIFYRPPSLDK